MTYRYSIEMLTVTQNPCAKNLVEGRESRWHGRGRRRHESKRGCRQGTRREVNGERDDHRTQRESTGRSSHSATLVNIIVFSYLSSCRPTTASSWHGFHPRAETLPPIGTGLPVHLCPSDSPTHDSKSVVYSRLSLHLQIYNGNIYLEGTGASVPSVPVVPVFTTVCEYVVIFSHSAVAS